LKAIILAAGKGSRLGNITKDTPKPMIMINTKPILEHNIRMCKEAGITDIHINLHYLPEKIKKYFHDGSKFGVNIKYNYEPEILGTAGALIPFLNEIRDEKFFVIYGDNYFSFNLLELESFHKKMNADISILLDWREDISQSGVVSLDNNDRVIRFIEKPNSQDVKSRWISAGIYLLNPSIDFEIFKSGFDFGFDVFPALLENKCKIYGLKTKNKMITIDTPQMLNNALNNN